MILAHDMERKWIQNHPVIQYENYLVKYIISEVVKYYQHKNISIFSFPALTIKVFFLRYRHKEIVTVKASQNLHKEKASCNRMLFSFNHFSTGHEAGTA